MIVVTLLAVPCAFVGWKINIVRERDEFIRTRDCYMAPNPFDEKRGDPSVPWAPGLLGAEPVYQIFVDSAAEVERARALFPEAIIHGPEYPDQAPTEWREHPTVGQPSTQP